MNFYAHYHFFHLDHQAEFNTGLVLPDFVRQSTGQRLKNLNGQYAAAFRPLATGCKMHIESDRWFHNSEFFSRIEPQIKTALLVCGFGASYPRNWFVTHILLELMLDRVLIKSSGNYLDRFYSSIEEADENLIAEFLILNDIENSTKLLEFLKRFTSAGYMFHYPDNEKFIHSLNRICQRINLPAFSSEQIRLLRTALPLIESLVEKNLSILHDDLAAFHVKSGDAIV